MIVITANQINKPSADRISLFWGPKKHYTKNKDANYTGSKVRLITNTENNGMTDDDIATIGEHIDNKYLGDTKPLKDIFKEHYCNKLMGIVGGYPLAVAVEAMIEQMGNIIDIDNIQISLLFKNQISFNDHRKQLFVNCQKLQLILANTKQATKIINIPGSFTTCFELNSKKGFQFKSLMLIKDDEESLQRTLISGASKSQLYFTLLEAATTTEIRQADLPKPDDDKITEAFNNDKLLFSKKDLETVLISSHTENYHKSRANTNNSEQPDYITDQNRGGLTPEEINAINNETTRNAFKQFYNQHLLSVAGYYPVSTTASLIFGSKTLNETIFKKNDLVVNIKPKIKCHFNQHRNELLISCTDLKFIILDEHKERIYKIKGAYYVVFELNIEKGFKFKAIHITYDPFQVLKKTICNPLDLKPLAKFLSQLINPSKVTETPSSLYACSSSNKQPSNSNLSSSSSKHKRKRSDSELLQECYQNYNTLSFNLGPFTTF